MSKSRMYIIRISLFVALGGFLMGFDASVISGVIKFIESQFGLSKIELGWAVSSLTLTSTLAMMVAGPLSDRFGRRIILRYAAVLYAFSAIASAFAPTFWVLVVARMIGGLGVGASLILAPMYISEISPAKIRGTMVSFNQLNIVLGITFAFFSNYIILKLSNNPTDWVQAFGIDKYNWRWMLGIEAIPAILYFIFLLFVPESPRWLAMQGHRDHALKILSKVESREIAENNLNALEQSMSTVQKKERVPFTELLKPAMKLVLLIGIVIAITQQITGINAVFFYAPMIFEQTGIGTDAAFSQAILVGVTNLVFTIIAMWLIDKVGRKFLLMVGLSGIIVSMALLTIGFGNATYTLDKQDIESLKETVASNNWKEVEGITYTSDVSFKDAMAKSIGSDVFNQHESEIITRAVQMNGWMVLIGIVGFVASFAVSLGPVMWVLFSELFPNRIRGLAISFTGFINSAVSFSVQLVFPWELASIGSSFTFLIYGIFGAVGLLIMAIYLPETKGKTLEELEIQLIK